MIFTRLPFFLSPTKARLSLVGSQRGWIVVTDGIVSRLLDCDGGTAAEISDAWMDSDTALGIRHHMKYRTEAPHPVLAFFVGLKINCLPGPLA